MSDVVPPGGDRPLDDEPWPISSPPIAPGFVAIPSVPASLPDGVATPPDWRTMTDASASVPPGYQLPGGRPVHVISRRDNFGIGSCVAGAAGLLQLLLLPVPLVAVLAIALALAARRFARLDPHGVGTAVLSTIGLALGAAGVVAGVGLMLAGTTSVIGG